MVSKAVERGVTGAGGARIGLGARGDIETKQLVGRGGKRLLTRRDGRHSVRAGSEDAGGEDDGSEETHQCASMCGVHVMFGMGSSP